MRNKVTTRIRSNVSTIHLMRYRQKHKKILRPQEHSSGDKPRHTSMGKDRTCWGINSYSFSQYDDVF